MDNDLVKALITIKDRMGVEVLADSHRMTALLADLAPGLVRDRKIIIRMIDAGVMGEFVSGDIPKAMGRAKTYFYDEEFMSTERAEYYLDVLSSVFGYTRTDRVEIKKENVEKETKKSSSESGQDEKKIETLEVTDGLVKRGYILLKDGDFTKADDCFERALDANPENSRAYVGKMLCEYKVNTFEDLKNLDIRIDGNNYYKKAIQYADTDYRRRLVGMQSYLTEKLDQKEAEERKRREDEAAQKAKQLMGKVERCLDDDKTAYANYQKKVSDCKIKISGIEKNYDDLSKAAESKIEADYEIFIKDTGGKEIEKAWASLVQQTSKARVIPDQKELKFLDELKTRTAEYLTRLTGRHSEYNTLMGKFKAIEKTYINEVEVLTGLVDNMKAVDTNGLDKNVFFELIKCVFLDTKGRTVPQLQILSPVLNKMDLKKIKGYVEYLVKKGILKERAGVLSIA